MIGLLSTVSILLYLISGGLLLDRIAKGAAASNRQKLLAIGIGLAGTLFHAWRVYSTIFTVHGVDLSLSNVVSLIAVLLVLMVLLASLTRPVENLGIVIMPMAAMSLAAHQIWPTPPNLLMESAPGMPAHILLSISAYALMSIAALQALLLAIQDNHLRNRHPGGFIRALPPLETMEGLLFQIIAVGFILLSLSLFTGVVFLEDIFAQHLVHKTLLSIIAWMMFATLLWGRWQFGWRGQVAIRWTLGGFVLLMLAFLGTKMVLELILA